MASSESQVSDEDYEEKPVIRYPSARDPLSDSCGSVPELTDTGLIAAHFSYDENSEIRPIRYARYKRTHYLVHELRNMWNWYRIFKELGTEQQCIEFAEARGLVPTVKLCGRHRCPMNINKHPGQFGSFRCRKGPCREKGGISRAEGTWFEQSRLSLVLVFQLMYAFSQNLSYFDAIHETVRPDLPVISTVTVSAWYQYCREAIAIYELGHQDHENKIGGPKKIVLIDLIKFQKRKLNKGLYEKDHWVLAMVENGSEDIRLEVCPDDDRTLEVLVPLIEKHVLEGSIIHTDDWSGYSSLSKCGFVHRCVKRTDSGATEATHKKTQRQPGLKKQFNQRHSKRDFTNCLCEYSWRRKIALHHLDPFEEIIRVILYVYNDIHENSFDTVVI